MDLGPVRVLDTVLRPERLCPRRFKRVRDVDLFERAVRWVTGCE